MLLVHLTAYILWFWCQQKPILIVSPGKYAKQFNENLKHLFFYWKWEWMCRGNERDHFLSLDPCLGVICRHTHTPPPRDGGPWWMNACIQVAFDKDQAMSCAAWFRGPLQIMVWLLSNLACSAHQLRTVCVSRAAAQTVGLFVNKWTFCRAPVCGRLFLEEGYPEDKVCPALTVVNRPPGPFQAICPQIGHALGGNDPRRE